MLWAHERLGIPIETLDWTLADAKAYKDHEWDGDENPLRKIGLLLGDSKWVGVHSATGTGKMQSVDSKVLTPDGWKRLGDIRVGDFVIGSDGKPTEVLAVYPQGEKDLYKVTMSDGSWTYAGEEHLWAVQTKTHKYRGSGFHVMTTGEIKRTIEKRWQIPMVAPVEFEEKDLPIDPYVMGVYLGNGSTCGSTPVITTPDEFVLSEIEARTEEGVSVRHRSKYDYGVATDRGKPNPVTDSLRELGIFGLKSHEKFIPKQYLLGSIEQRIALLHGLMDSDGTIDARNGTVFSFTTTSRQLASGVRELVQSLGGTASKVEVRRTHYTHNGEKRQGRVSYRQRIKLPNDISPFLLPRQADKVRERSRYGLPRRIIESIEYSHKGEAVCIRVAAEDSLYVTDEYIVTHNTYLAAILVLWFLDCWPKTETTAGGIVISLSPKEDQLKLNLWKEISRLWDKFQKIRPQARLMNLRIRMDPESDDKDAWGAVGYAVGVGADEESANRMRGFHGAHMLFILEETPGIPPPVITAIQNTCTSPHNLILALGNPDSEYDTLAEFCRKPMVEPVRISAYDHPNVVLKDPLFIPGAVSQKSIDDRLALYGGDDTHPLYESMVRGIIPVVASTSLFRPDAIEKAGQCIRTPVSLIKHVGYSEGETRIYEMPEGTHINRYLIWCDVGGDAGTGDWHAAIVLDRLDKSVSAVIHMRGPRDDYAHEILRLAEMYSVTCFTDKPRTSWPVIAWETNGVGALHLVPEFKAYPELYRRRSMDMMDARPRSTLGWYTTEKVRDIMIDELEAWSIDLIYRPEMLRDMALLNECKTFVWSDKKSRYEAKSGYHDDLVMALAGALALDKMLTPPAKAIMRLPGEDNSKNLKRHSAAPDYMGNDIVPTYHLPPTP